MEISYERTVTVLSLVWVFVIYFFMEFQKILMRSSALCEKSCVKLCDNDSIFL